MSDISTINTSSKITLHFSLGLENGDTVDSTFGKAPATFVMGDGSLLPGFEKPLLGLKAGDKKQFLIQQQDAFGAHNPQNIQHFKRSSFQQDALQEGMIVSFADAAGNELPGVVKQIGSDDVTVDFNHPLAGRSLVFSVEIIHVQ